MKTKRTAASVTAISIILLSFLLTVSSVSFAATEAGRVTHLSGPLFAKKADGTTMVLSINSTVVPGDTLVTEKKTYARIKFTDNSEITLRPGTQLKLSKYTFNRAKPKDDSIVIDFIKGGMRALTGLIGKRGDLDAYRLNTPTSTAGVRGTAYECKICEGNCGALPDGLYLFVLEGVVNVRNEAGSQDVSAGQYVYVATMTSVPQILPGNPGIDFTLPAFTGFGEAPPPSAGSAPNAASGCLVR